MFSTHPNRISEYRAAKHLPATPTRYCAGCKKRRSTRQFQGEAMRCMQCQRRGL